ncbi:MAG TPA: flagellar hook-basal body complex protein FliE [Polyangiaceae bacterium]|nr:flagellar hook-basal body complex protein FliE [Polyangiaceae bacterium]
MDNAMLASIRAVEARITRAADELAQPLPAQHAARAAADGGAAGFADRLREALHDVDASERLAAEKMAAVDAGRSDDLVGAMLASQQASLNFSMLLQIRNKLAGALDELIKLQI